MDQIIVRMPNWIGDLIMATPLLADLRRHFPSASITAMCRAPLSELLQEDESIDELFTFRRPENDFSRRQVRRDLVEKLRAGKYEVGILTPRSFSSAWWFWQGRVKRRIGFQGRFRSLLLTDGLPWPEQKEHLIDTYKHLLEPLGIPHSNTPPRLFIKEEERVAARELLRQRGYRKGQPLIAIHPGAAYGVAKSWPIDRYRELVEKLSKREGWFVLVLGDNSLRSAAQQLCQGLPNRVIDLAGTTSLRELAALLQESSLLVCNDSGPMHMASALGTPLIALFGSTDDLVTGPHGQKSVVINKRVSCAPCLRRVCPIDFRCMLNISVEEVLRKIDHVLEQ